MPDELVYESGRQYEPDVEVEDWQEVGYVGGKKIKKPDVDISPEGWNELLLYDIDDDSFEWVKHAYANSLQGTVEAWKNGKLEYLKRWELLGKKQQEQLARKSYLIVLIRNLHSMDFLIN